MQLFKIMATVLLATRQLVAAKIIGRTRALHKTFELGSGTHSSIAAGLHLDCHEADDVPLGQVELMEAGNHGDQLSDTMTLHRAATILSGDVNKPELAPMVELAKQVLYKGVTLKVASTGAVAYNMVGTIHDRTSPHGHRWLPFLEVNAGQTRRCMRFPMIAGFCNYHNDDSKFPVSTPLSLKLGALLTPIRPFVEWDFAHFLPNQIQQQHEMYGRPTGIRKTLKQIQWDCGLKVRVSDVYRPRSGAEKDLSYDSMWNLVQAGLGLWFQSKGAAAFEEAGLAYLYDMEQVKGTWHLIHPYLITLRGYAHSS